MSSSRSTRFTGRSAGASWLRATPAWSRFAALIRRPSRACGDACTNPERLPRWFLPVTGDLRVGGRYQLASNASGAIERCEPPHGFTATWEYGGSVSWIEVRLSPESEDTTRLELDHITLVADDDKWAQFG